MKTVSFVIFTKNLTSTLLWLTGQNMTKKKVLGT